MILFVKWRVASNIIYSCIMYLIISCGLIWIDDHDLFIFHVLNKYRLFYRGLIENNKNTKVEVIN